VIPGLFSGFSLQEALPRALMALPLAFKVAFF
jgi:hypothetical protein